MFTAVSLAFALSGAASLVFEVVWFHRASLVFGNSVWATSVVLSSFMAGLAIGNASVERLGRRLRQPLRTYAALEAIVGLTGVAVTLALPALPRVVVPLTRAAGDAPWLVNLIRLLVAFVMLVIPTACMGATLPVLTAAPAHAGAGFGRVLGRLYGWNTFGAVAGVLLAEVVLVERVGVTGSAWIAALLNLSAAAIALQAIPPTPLDRPVVPVVSPGATTLLPARLLASAALAGAALLALEVIWFRFLSMYVLTTTLAASLMLAAVLFAIGLGGFAAAAWLRRNPDASTHVPAIACLTGCAIVASYAVFQVTATSVQVGEWWRVLWFACVLTGPVAFLSGLLFTLLGDAVARGLGAPLAAAARLTLANTTGAMCGPMIAAFVLLPLLGTARALFTLALVYGGIAMLAWPPARLRSPERVQLGAGVAGVALIVALVFFPFGLSARSFARIASPYAADGSVVVATKEGPSETIQLMQRRWLGQPVYSRLVTNGFSMSGTATTGQRYMRDFVYWPMLLHAAPLRKILIVCYGVGVTAGAATEVAAAESIDVVELSREVVSMSEAIYPPARQPLRDPRVRRHIEDGRSFLQTTTERFDLITGEPPPPRTPGAASLYTREYFQLARDHLADGGMITYWLPVARPQPGADVDTIIRGFCEVFEDCSLWNATPFDFMLVGSRHAGQQSAEAFTAPWRVPALASRLREVGFEQPEQFGATFLGDAAYLRELTATTPPLTDDFPYRIVPVAARPSLSDQRYRDDPRPLERFQRVLDPIQARQRFATSPFVRGLWPASLVEPTLAQFDTQRIINRVLWEGGQPLRQIEDLHHVLTTTTLRTLPLWLLGSDEVTQRIAESDGGGSPATAYARGLRALSNRDYLRAAAEFGEAERLGLRSPIIRPLQVYALCLAGDLDAARLLARGVAISGPDDDHFWSWMRTTFGIADAR